MTYEHPEIAIECSNFLEHLYDVCDKLAVSWDILHEEYFPNLKECEESSHYPSARILWMFLGDPNKHRVIKKLKGIQDEKIPQDDLKFVSASLETSSKLLVSHDQKHLVSEEIKGYLVEQYQIKAIKPREYI